MAVHMPEPACVRALLWTLSTDALNNTRWHWPPKWHIQNYSDDEVRWNGSLTMWTLFTFFKWPCIVHPLDILAGKILHWSLCGKVAICVIYPPLTSFHGIMPFSLNWGKQIIMLYPGVRSTRENVANSCARSPTISSGTSCSRTYFWGVGEWFLKWWTSIQYYFFVTNVITLYFRWMIMQIWNNKVN